LTTRPFAHLLALAAALLALLSGLGGVRPAFAQADESAAMAPRDVVDMVQPALAELPPVPQDFVRIDRGWIALELPRSVSDRADGLVRAAAELRERLSADLGQPVLDHVLVRIARTPEQMAELSPRGAPPPPYAAGVAHPSLHLALLALQAPETWEAPDLTELLRHELTHLALTDAVGGNHVPRWFDEGFAVHESGELPVARFWALWDATVSKRLLPLADLDRSFPMDRYDVNVAYAESADFVRFLMRDADRARYGSLVDRVRAGVPFARALEDAYGTDVAKLEYEWREDRSRRFGLAPVLTGSGLLWVVIVGLMVAAWMKRRRRAQATLAQWAREEAEQQARMQAAAAPFPQLASGRASDAQPAQDAPVSDVPSGRRSSLPPSLPLVEHDGRWYTLH
jgi:hypothetical protein